MTQEQQPPQPKPNYQSIRNKILDSWRVAKKAESKERIAAALDKFIEAVEEAEPPAMQPNSPSPSIATVVQVPPSPSKTEFENLKKQIIDTQIGLMGELRKRDNQIATLAHAIAQIEPGIDTSSQLLDDPES